MKTMPLVAFSGAVALQCAACVSSLETRRATAPVAPANGSGPNWNEIDRTVQRVKEREGSKLRLVETERTTSSGFAKMTDEEYAAALETAREEISKANPKLSDRDVEAAAVKQADEAKRRAELTYTQSASSTYEVKRP